MKFCYFSFFTAFFHNFLSLECNFSFPFLENTTHTSVPVPRSPSSSFRFLLHLLKSVNMNVHKVQNEVKQWTDMGSETILSGISLRIWFSVECEITATSLPTKLSSIVEMLKVC